MARTATAQTLNSHVYQAIRTEILNGAFQPGERLKPSELRERYNVSVSVIREALSRLAEKHLVRGEHNQGFRVAPLTENDLLDLTAVRTVNEGFALRTALARGDIAWESRVVAAAHRLFATPARDNDNSQRPTDAWSDAHRDFHRSLIEACDMPVLLDICDSLFDASELYRRLSSPFTASRRDVVAEHRMIMEAALARNADLAVQRLSEHFQLTTQLLIDGLLRQAPEKATNTVLQSQA